jgi:hypothetical protein
MDFIKTDFLTDLCKIKNKKIYIIKINKGIEYSMPLLYIYEMII